MSEEEEDSLLDLSKLRTALDSATIEWERHVLERLVLRQIPREAVIHALRSGECIEDYPHGRPFPSALFLGWFGRAPLHVVAALDERIPKVFIITAYEPDIEHFEPDFKTRRKR